MDLEVVDPSTHPKWDELVLSHPDGTFFHSSLWAKVLHGAYGFTPRYFANIQGQKLAVAFPMMEVDSFLTGKRGVSLPFTDYCDPLLGGDTPFTVVNDEVTEYGKRSRWKSIEWRCRKRLLPDVPESCTFLGHVLDLSPGEEKLFSGLRDSTKRNIKKAKKERVEFTISKDPGGMKEFYRLNCLTRREHGLPPQPYKFFCGLQEDIVRKDQGFFALALHAGRCIAGGFFLHMGDRAYYKYGASEKMHQDLRGNNLLMWEVIKWFSSRNFKTFCFGRTEMGNEGLKQFKGGWGGAENTIYYYSYDLKKRKYFSNRLLIKGFHNDILKRMPIPLLRGIGSVMYRHVA